MSTDAIKWQGGRRRRLANTRRPTAERQGVPKLRTTRILLVAAGLATQAASEHKELAAQTTEAKGNKQPNCCTSSGILIVQTAAAIWQREQIQEKSGGPRKQIQTENGHPWASLVATANVNISCDCNQLKQLERSRLRHAQPCRRCAAPHPFPAPIEQPQLSRRKCALPLEHSLPCGESCAC